MEKPINNAILIAACPALLYSWGTASYNGFFGIFKLDADMMERSVHQIIYSGVVVSFSPILWMLSIAVGILFIWSHGILPSYIRYVRGSIKAKRRVITVKWYWQGKNVLSAFEEHEKKRFIQSIFYFLLGFLFLFSLVYFENKGQINAKNILENHLSGKNKPDDIVSVVINKNDKLLRYLGCGFKNCAGIEEKSNQIYYFPQSSSYSFTYIPKI